MTLSEHLALHRPADDAEAADLASIRAFVARHAQPFDRTIREGHLTGSAIVVSAAGDAVVLVRHRKLALWLQPGGHAEPHETDAETVALREAEEETGLPALALHPHAPRPLDVDVHDIPAFGAEPAHQHLDLRYLVVAPAGAALRHAPDESDDIRWVAWDALEPIGLDPGLTRALAKARALVISGR